LTCRHFDIRFKLIQEQAKRRAASNIVATEQRQSQSQKRTIDSDNNVIVLDDDEEDEDEQEDYEDYEEEDVEDEYETQKGNYKNTKTHEDARKGPETMHSRPSHAHAHSNSNSNPNNQKVKDRLGKQQSQTHQWTSDHQNPSTRNKQHSSSSHHSLPPPPPPHKNYPMPYAIPMPYHPQGMMYNPSIDLTIDYPVFLHLKKLYLPSNLLVITSILYIYGNV
jgi:hypothetical protein